MFSDFDRPEEFEAEIVNLLKQNDEYVKATKNYEETLKKLMQKYPEEKKAILDLDSFATLIESLAMSTTYEKGHQDGERHIISLCKRGGLENG